MSRRLPTLLAAVAGPPPDARPDADLVARFLATRDAAAFEALVLRHGPMVRAVCRGVLANHADADDAFQAAFLVLARKAANVRNRQALGGWLYGVAYRVATKLRRQRDRRPTAAEDLSVFPAPPPADPDPDTRAAVAREIDRLPEKYRFPVQLCYVAGHTTAEAAARLGWPKGTVLSRLAWARRRLQERLLARGIAPAALAGTTAIDPALVRATVAAAVGSGTGAVIGEGVRQLTEGVIRDMATSKLRLMVGGLVTAAALTGVGVGRWGAAVGADGPPVAATAQTPRATEPQPALPSRPTPPPADLPPAPSKPGLPPATTPAPPADRVPPAMPSGPPPSASATKDDVAELIRELRTLRDKVDRLEQKVNEANRPPVSSPSVPALDLPAPLSPPRAMTPPPADLPPVEPKRTSPPPMPTDLLPPVRDSADIPPTVRPAASQPALTLPEAAPEPPNEPTGTVHRAAGGHTFALSFIDNKFKATNVVATENGPVTVVAEGEIQTTKDGMAYGLIRSVETDAGDDEFDAELPFSFRYRLDRDNGVLTVRDVKVRTGDWLADDVVLIAAGRYTTEKPAANARPARSVPPRRVPGPVADEMLSPPALPAVPNRRGYDRPDGSNRLVPTPKPVTPPGPPVAYSATAGVGERIDRLPPAGVGDTADRR